MNRIVARGNPERVEDLVEHLVNSYNAYTMDPAQAELEYVDGFVATLNFAWTVVEDQIVRRGADDAQASAIRRTAIATFARWMGFDVKLTER